MCSEKERIRGDHEVWTCQGNVVGVLEDGFETKFAYDHVFPGHVENELVYETVASSIVKSALDGINGTIFAYGVTSSGKTYTMMGTDTQPGIVPHAIAEVYHLISNLSTRKEFALRLSMLEIYNEVVNDLLNPVNTNLRLREDPRRGVVVDGVTEERLRSSEHALRVVAEGNENRKTSATAFNEGSSRSHTVIRLSIEANERAEYSSEADARVGRTLSYLTMVDLAGSESARAELNRSHRVEGSYINKSLLTLGTVIHKLAEGGAMHIPFRDSKLTRLLSSSLTGNGARVSVICTITPTSAQAEETHNTLKFASRAKKIAIEAKRNEILDQSSLIARYQQELSILRHQLEVVMREKGVRGRDLADVEIRTLMEKYEEEHQAVVQLEKEKEKLEDQIESKEKCIADVYLSLDAAQRRLEDSLTPQGVVDENESLRRQVLFLANEIGEKDRIIKALRDEKGDTELVEEDVALPELMMAEIDFMKLQIENLNSENQKLLGDLRKLKHVYAESQSLDPASIDVNSLPELSHNDAENGEESVASTNISPLSRSCNKEIQDKILKMEERLSKFFEALKRKDGELSRQREVQKTLSGLQDQVHLQLTELMAENKNLKKENARIEKQNQQLQGLDVDGMNHLDLLALIKHMTEACNRVRLSMKLKQVQFRVDKDAHEAFKPSSTLKQQNGKMSMEELQQAISSLKEYGARRASLSPKIKHVPEETISDKEENMLEAN